MVRRKAIEGRRDLSGGLVLGAMLAQANRGLGEASLLLEQRRIAESINLLCEVSHLLGVIRGAIQFGGSQLDRESKNRLEDLEGKMITWGNDLEFHCGKSQNPCSSGSVFVVHMETYDENREYRTNQQFYVFTTHERAVEFLKRERFREIGIGDWYRDDVEAEVVEALVDLT